MKFSHVLALAWFALPSLAHAASYEIDPVHSSAQFAVKHMMISTVRGEFTKLSGTAVIDDKDLAKANIGFMTFMHELHYFTAVFGSDYAHGTLTYDQLTRGVELLDTSAAHAITAITQPTDEGTTGTAKKPARARQ